MKQLINNINYNKGIAGHRARFYMLRPSGSTNAEPAVHYVFFVSTELRKQVHVTGFCTLLHYNLHLLKFPSFDWLKEIVLIP